MNNDNMSTKEIENNVTEMNSKFLQNDFLREVRILKRQYEKMRFLNRSSIVDCKKEIKNLKKIIVDENIKMHKILTK